MLPVNSGGHSAYQDFVTENLRKYYPNPNALPRATWDIIERFWNLDLSYTDELLRDKYSIFGPKPRTPSCMQRSYLLSIDFKVDSITDWATQLKINPLWIFLCGNTASPADGEPSVRTSGNRSCEFTRVMFCLSHIPHASKCHVQHQCL